MEAEEEGSTALIENGLDNMPSDSHSGPS